MAKEWLKNNIMTLRSPEPEDLALLYEMENDTTLWNIGNSVQPYSRYALRSYLEQTKQDIYVDKQVRFIIELQNKEAVGMVDLVDFDAHNKRAEVCIGLLEKYRGQGLGYMALSVIGDYAFNFLQIHQLYAYIPENNTCSLNLFKKAGYKECAKLEEWKLQENKYCNVVIVQLIGSKGAF